MIKKARSLLKSRDPIVHKEDNVNGGTLKLNITNPSENGNIQEDES